VVERGWVGLCSCLFLWAALGLSCVCTQGFALGWYFVAPLALVFVALADRVNPCSLGWAVRAFARTGVMLWPVLVDWLLNLQADPSALLRDDNSSGRERSVAWMIWRERSRFARCHHCFAGRRTRLLGLLCFEALAEVLGVAG